MTSARGIGTRWIDALVAEGDLGGADHSRGRGLFARGAIHDVTVEPGSVSALVRTRAAEPRRVSIGIARLSSEQWDTAAETVRSNGSWQAAVIEGTVPPELTVAFAEAGCSVLLDTTTTSIECDCERPGALCSHAAAVCEHVASLLDADPLLILTLRNGDRERFIARATGRVGADDAAGQGAPSASAASPSDDFVSAIVSHGSPELLDAAASWRRKPAALRTAHAGRRVPGRPRLAAQPPPAELGVTQRGIDALATDSIARASALLSSLDLADAAAARALSGIGSDVEHDVVRLAGARRISTIDAAASLGIDESVAANVIVETARHGVSAFELLARPRRLTDADVELVTAATDARIRTRSTGALFDDGRQLRRTSDGTWAVVAVDATGGWSIEQLGTDLVEVLDAAEIDLTDPDR